MNSLQHRQHAAAAAAAVLHAPRWELQPIFRDILKTRMVNRYQLRFFYDRK